MTTTIHELQGYNITESLGLVRGVAVRSRGFLGRAVAKAEMDWGGEVTTFTEMCERTRNDALMRMWAHAEQLGAHAVVGFCYETNELAVGVAEVLCYGTAIRVERAP